MNFDFSDEQKLLQQTARDYLTEHAPLASCRARARVRRALRRRALEGRRGDGLARRRDPGGATAARASATSSWR